MKYLCIFHQAKALKDKQYAQAAMQQTLRMGTEAWERCDLPLARRCFGCAFEIALLHTTPAANNNPISPKQLAECTRRLSNTLYMLGEISEIERNIQVASQKLEGISEAEGCSDTLKQEVKGISQALKMELCKLSPSSQAASSFN